MTKWRFFTQLSLCFLLLGCTGETLQGTLEDYSTRLQRVLEQNAVSTQHQSESRFSSKYSVNFPAKRDLTLTVPITDIDLMEFLQLGDCQLQGVVAEKNSSLGRLAEASIVLRQDVEFILLAEQCLSVMERPELIATIQAATEQKKRNLRVRLWNAVIASQEYRAFWTAGKMEYPYVAESSLQGSLSVLHTQVKLLLSQEFESFDANQFEEALRTLRSGEAAALSQSWLIVSRVLEQATEVLKARAARRPLCYQGMRNQQAEYFRNVVLNQFVGSVQKDLAVLNQRYYDVVVPVQAMELLFADVETEAYRQYRLARDRAFIHGIDTVKNHVDAIQPLMIQCGFLPDV